MSAHGVFAASARLVCPGSPRRQGAVRLLIAGALPLIAAALLSARPAAADRPIGPCASTADADAPFDLLYGGRHDVERARRAAELRELSGVALEADAGTPAGYWLWLVDDGKRNLFRADVDGAVGSGDADKVELSRSLGQDLEGLAYRADERALYAVQEDAYRIVRVGLSRGGAAARVTGTFALADMDGYETIAAANDPRAVPLATYVSTSSEAASNQGLEGIAYFRGATASNRGQGSFFVVKERSPGLLIEIDGDLDRILGFTVLNCGEYPAAGCPACTCPGAGSLPFSDRVGGATRDFSGLSYDRKRRRLWIASDAGTAVFLYDVDARTYDTFPLRVGAGGECVQQVEGVAYVERLDALKVVSDREDSAAVFDFGIAY